VNRENEQTYNDLLLSGLGYLEVDTALDQLQFRAYWGLLGISLLGLAAMLLDLTWPGHYLFTSGLVLLYTTILLMFGMRFALRSDPRVIELTQNMNVIRTLLRLRELALTAGDDAADAAASFTLQRAKEQLRSTSQNQAIKNCPGWLRRWLCRRAEASALESFSAETAEAVRQRVLGSQVAACPG
jgi:hypothetical protein